MATKEYHRQWRADNPERFDAIQKRYIEKNKHSAKYKARNSWCRVQSRCLNRDGRNPTYANVECRMSRAEFMEWAIPEYERCLALAPDEMWSVDRIKDEGHYEIGNIQLIPLAENSRKRKWNKSANAPEGLSWCNKCEQYKPLESFGIDRVTPKGVRYECMECVGQKRRGTWIAGSKWVSPDEANHIRELYASGHSMAQVAKLVSRSRQTVCNVVNHITKV